MTERTKLLKLKCIRSQVFDAYGELMLRVPADATEQEIRELGGEQGVDWRLLPWHQISQPELSCRADDPFDPDAVALLKNDGEFLGAACSVIPAGRRAEMILCA